MSTPGLDELKVATRVLAELAENREPLASDVGRLREIVPDGARLSLEELACEAIQEVLRGRAKVREAMNGL
jgi:hypothetical protein